jgi:hypothetical protein
MVTTNQRVNTADIGRFYKLITRPGDVREIRDPKTSDGVLYAYCDNEDAFVRAAAEWSGRAPGIYATANPVLRALMKDAPNTLIPFKSKLDGKGVQINGLAGDDSITQCAIQYIDVDAGQDADESSTDEQQAGALALTDQTYDYLISEGVLPSAMIKAGTGNGGGIYLAIEMANSPESTELRSRFLQYLDFRLGGNKNEPHIDTGVFNAARIVKIPGTMACKGPNTTERPHRLARIITAPDVLEPTPRNIIKAIADKMPKKPEPKAHTNGNGRGSDIDWPEFIAKHSIPTIRVKEKSYGRIYEVPCPWNPKHNTGSCFLTAFAGGGIDAGCHHDECRGKILLDYVRVYEPDFSKKKTARAITGNVIVTNDRELPDITADAFKAVLVANNPARIFQHGPDLARIQVNQDTKQPIIQNLSVDALGGEMARAAKWIDQGRKGDTFVMPPIRVVKDFATMPGGWSGIPNLKAITEAPMVRPDGTILDVAGYDEMTQTYYQPSDTMPSLPIPEHPTVETVAKCRDILMEVFCNFPFDSDASRANIMAGLITPVARPLINGPTPMLAIDKTAPGSGASLIAQVFSLITTGRNATMYTAPKDPEEWRKLIISILLEGRSNVVIDNVDGALYDSTLAAVLTSPIYSGRMLSKNEIKDLPNNVNWVCTGNNLTFKGDIPRRIYLARIDVDMAKPWQRDTDKFKHPDILKWVLDDRALILAAILTIIRAWIDAGQPASTKKLRLGGYESWVRVIGGILDHAGIDGFLMNLAEMYEANDGENPAWAAFFSAWYEKFTDTECTCSTLLSAMAGDAVFEAVVPIDPPHHDKKTGMIEDGGFTKKLGHALSARKGRNYQGEDAGTEYKLTPAGTTHRVAKWKVIKKIGGCILLDPKTENEAKGVKGVFQQGSLVNFGTKSKEGKENNSNNRASADINTPNAQPRLNSDEPEKEYTAEPATGNFAALSVTRAEVVEIWTADNSPDVPVPGGNIMDLLKAMDSGPLPDGILAAIFDYLITTRARLGK